jgi:hypothetical protein
LCAYSVPTSERVFTAVRAPGKGEKKR